MSTCRGGCMSTCRSGCMCTHRGAMAGHEGAAVNPNGIRGVASSGASYRTSGTVVHIIRRKCRCRCGVRSDVHACMMGAGGHRGLCKVERVA